MHLPDARGLTDANIFPFCVTLFFLYTGFYLFLNWLLSIYFNNIDI